MAELEKEITVKVKWELDEVKVNFVNKGIPLVGSFVLNDMYMIRNEVDAKESSNSSILGQSVIIRERTVTHPDKVLVYKNRKYNEKGEIVDGEKFMCPLVDVDKAYKFLNAIGYKECFRIEQECLEYKYNDISIFIAYIADLGLFLELESNNKSIEELKEALKKLEIAYYEDDYFVKKASLMLDNIRKSGR